MCDDDIGGAGGPRYLVMTNPPGDSGGLADPQQAGWRTGPLPKPVSVAGPGHRCPRVAAVARLVGDVDDAFHAERGVLAVVLGVKEAGQHPEAGPDVDDLLLSGAVGQGVEEGGKPVARCCA